MNHPPASRSGCGLLKFLGLLGILASLGFSPSLHLDPGISLAEQFGHRQAIVAAQAVGFLPGAVVRFVAAGGNDAVPGAFVAGIAPMVTCKTPSRILCAGCFDIMISFSLGYEASDYRGLRRHQRSTGSREAQPSGKAKGQGSRRETALAALPAWQVIHTCRSQGHWSGAEGERGRQSITKPLPENAGGDVASKAGKSKGRQEQ